MGLALAAPDDLVVADHLGHQEVQELLGEFGVEVCVDGEGPQAGDLPGLAGRVGRRQALARLQLADLAGLLEPFGQQMDQRRVDVVDRAAAFQESNDFLQLVPPARPLRRRWPADFDGFSGPTWKP